MLVGYARVSTQDQNLELQLKALKKIGCKKLYEDQMSSTRINRPGLKLALEVQGLVDLVNELHQNGTHFKSITDNVDTSTPSGRFFFHIMASLAQMERELVAERTMDGLTAAKAQGRIGGRKRKMTKSKIEQAKKLLASGTLPKDVAQNLGVSIPTLYRWIPASSYA